MRALFLRFKQFLDWAWAEFIQALQPALRLCDPHTLETELKILYARGALDEPAYRQWVLKVRRGQVGRGDLDLLQNRLRRQAWERGEFEPARTDPEVERSLNQLYIQRVQLEEAEAWTRQSLQGLENDLQTAHARRQAAWETAQQTLPDEAAAREHLETHYDLQVQIQHLESHRETLRAALQQHRAARRALHGFENELQALAAQVAVADGEYGWRASSLHG